MAHILELPGGTLLGTHSATDEIARCLSSIVGDRWFTHLDVVGGGDRSIRVLLTKKPPLSLQVVELPSPMPALNMAKELVRFANEARYPDAPKNTYALRGWALKSVLIDGEWAVVASAEWVH